MASDRTELEWMQEDASLLHHNISPNVHYIPASNVWMYKNKNSPIDAITCVQRFVSCALSLTIIGSIISEILLLINIYSNHHARIFFELSLIFLLIPLTLCSFALGLISHGSFPKIGQFKWLMFIPYINIPLALCCNAIYTDHISSFSAKMIALFDAIIVGFMSFPLYIINLSYLLDTTDSYSDISIYNRLQLAFSVVLFCKAPIDLILTIAERESESVSFVDECYRALAIFMVFFPYLSPHDECFVLPIFRCFQGNIEHYHEFADYTRTDHSILAVYVFI